MNPYIKEASLPKELVFTQPVTLITPHGSFAWGMRRPLNYFDHQGKFHPSEQFFPVMQEIEKLNLENMSSDALSDLNRRLDPAYIRVNLNNNQGGGGGGGDYDIAKVILPLKKKKQILGDVPHFKEEYRLFLDKLKQADEVYLIGKDFLSSDQDIAEDIKSVCSSSKKGKIIFVNPETKNVRWITEHKAIFNATTHASYVDLPDYVSHLTKGG